jgi:hypothetical protein
MTHPQEKDHGHGDPEGSIEIWSFQRFRFGGPHDVVTKVFWLEKVQKDSTDATDNVIGINVKVHFVRVETQTHD